jgi:hypothetical protein
MRHEKLNNLKEKRDILEGWGNGFGHIVRSNCSLKHIIKGKMEGAIEVTGRRRRRRESLLADLNKKRGRWKMKKEAQNPTLWRISLGRGYGMS